ncbi:hypothetical protein SCLCIDRAFT_1207008 [Scleroderma citrinum Foug A]|uniref:Uncharacterized protein n=1 Tax=Scleroderma citrinum Foug A TaxID=1036808 RepID=A0A0C3ERU3_9AGAM|nr:hypothetical protein SCLCIDRAFT_1207008 [Scleroderma citrinum Foug A]
MASMNCLTPVTLIISSVLSDGKGMLFGSNLDTSACPESESVINACVTIRFGNDRQ